MTSAMRAPEFWRRESRSPWPVLLTPLGALYAFGGRWRRRRTTAFVAGRPVICVGNLVAGGSGKTPAALAISRHLREQGCTVHFLTRGYGGRLKGPVQVDPAAHMAADVGDEPLLLAAAAPTWVSADRPSGARAAIAAGAQIIVMDDGHQNPTLHKDMSLIVMDTEYGVGNGRVMPAGPLREPVADGMRRADAVISVGAVAGGTEDSRVRTTGTGKPLLRARIAPGPEVYTYAEQGVVAFAGIGRPEKFFETLHQAGAHLLAAHPFADHHPYSPEEIMGLVEEAAAHGAKLVTTEKDAVRLPHEARPMVETLSVTLEFADPGALAHLLAPLVARALRESHAP